MRGAGSGQGGELLFLIGLLMIVAGLYLLFKSISFDSHCGLETRLYSVGGVGITSGILLIPLIAGVIFIFEAMFIPWCSVTCKSFEQFRCFYNSV